MPQSQDYRNLYENKCTQFDQLSDQFNELQQQSTLIMNDLQDEIKQLKRKNELLQRQIKELKQKNKYIASTIERELDQAQKEKNQFKSKFKEFEKKVIQLEIINEDFQNQLRAAKATIQEYQSTTQKTMEELAILRVELQQSTNSNQEQIARLRQQLKETQEEISVMHKKNKKSENQHPVPTNVNSKEQNKVDFVNQSPQNFKRSPSCFFQNMHHNPPNNSNSNFRKTLRDIKDYLQSIDIRKQELRKTLLMQKQYTVATSS